MSWFSSTESPDLSRIPGASLDVPISSHSVVPLADVEYDTGDNTFWYGELDVTAKLTTAQRRAFPSYEEAGIEQTNLDNYVKKTGDTTSGGSDSTLGLVVDGVKSDAVGIANSVRTFFGGDPSSAGSVSDFKKLVYVVIIGGLLYLVWKIVSVWRAK